MQGVLADVPSDSLADDELLREVTVLEMVGVAVVAKAHEVPEPQLLPCDEQVLSQVHLSDLTLEWFSARATVVPEQHSGLRELSHLSDQASLPC